MKVHPEKAVLQMPTQMLGDGIAGRDNSLVVDAVRIWHCPSKPLVTEEYDLVMVFEDELADQIHRREGAQGALVERDLERS